MKNAAGKMLAYLSAAFESLIYDYKSLTYFPSKSVWPSLRVLLPQRAWTPFILIAFLQQCTFRKEAYDVFVKDAN